MIDAAADIDIEDSPIQPIMVLSPKARATETIRKASVMPPHFKVPEHSHSHDEFFVVVEGGCTFDDDVELGKGDCIVIYARHRYGFTCGPEGMDFMTIRTAEASVKMDN